MLSHIAEAWGKGLPTFVFSMTRKSNPTANYLHAHSNGTIEDTGIERNRFYSMSPN